MDASRTQCQADATNRVYRQRSKAKDELYGTRQATHNWEKKWQKVLVDNHFEIGMWSPAIVCCRERELCRFVHGDDFIFTGHSMQLVWADSRLNEKFTLKRRAILGPDDGDDNTVTILNRLVTWVCLSGSRNQREIRADPRHREI